MAFSSRAITTNESTAGLRTVVFGVFTTADGTAKTDLTAATALIHTNGAAGTASTANFAHVSNGRYSLVLTQAEVNLAANTHLLIGPANAAGYYVSPCEVLITPVRQDANVTQIAGQTASAAGTVTFPGTVASTTNITAATGVVLSGVTHTGAVIPTVTTTTTATNLTNAPSAGDFTATMKTSIGTAVAASAVASVTGNVGGNVTGSVGSLAAQAKTDVNTEVIDVLRTDTVAELAAVPAANAALSAKINWLFMKARNLVTQTATTQIVKADDGTTTVATSTVSDDGTTATRGEFI